MLGPGKGLLINSWVQTECHPESYPKKNRYNPRKHEEWVHLCGKLNYDNLLSSVGSGVARIGPFVNESLSINDWNLKKPLSLGFNSPTRSRGWKVTPEKQKSRLWALPSRVKSERCSVFEKKAWKRSFKSRYLVCGVKMLFFFQTRRLEVNESTLNDIYPISCCFFLFGALAGILQPRTPKQSHCTEAGGAIAKKTWWGVEGYLWVIYNAAFGGCQNPLTVGKYG